MLMVSMFFVGAALAWSMSKRLNVVGEPVDACLGDDIEHGVGNVALADEPDGICSAVGDDANDAACAERFEVCLRRGGTAFIGVQHMECHGKGETHTLLVEDDRASPLRRAKASTSIDGAPMQCVWIQLRNDGGEF